MKNNPAELKANPHYVILLTTGIEDGGLKATLAFSAACSAGALDQECHIFLMGNGSYWAYQGHEENIQQKGFPALEELMANFLELGGHLYLCSACDGVCGLDTEEIIHHTARKRADIEVRGMASVLAYTLQGSVISF